jgi:hypothetical protein
MGGGRGGEAWCDRGSHADLPLGDLPLLIPAGTGSGNRGVRGLDAPVWNPGTRGV